MYIEHVKTISLLHIIIILLLLLLLLVQPRRSPAIPGTGGRGAGREWPARGAMEGKGGWRAGSDAPDAGAVRPIQGAGWDPRGF